MLGGGDWQGPSSAPEVPSAVPPDRTPRLPQTAVGAAAWASSPSASSCLLALARLPTPLLPQKCSSGSATASQAPGTMQAIKCVVVGDG